MKKYQARRPDSIAQHIPALSPKKNAVRMTAGKKVRKGKPGGKYASSSNLTPSAPPAIATATSSPSHARARRRSVAWIACRYRGRCVVAGMMSPLAVRRCYLGATNAPDTDDAYASVSEGLYVNSLGCTSVDGMVPQRAFI